MDLDLDLDSLYTPPIAVMATFAPQPLTSSQSHPADFLPASPPDPSSYTMHTAPHDPALALPTHAPDRVQHRQSTEFKVNGHAPGFANGHGGMPVPNGMQHHLPNPASRHRGTVSMGAFDGPRSPPNTKSTLHRFSGTGR